MSRASESESGSRHSYTGRSASRYGACASAGLPGSGLYLARHFRTGEDHQVTGIAGPFLTGILIAITITAVFPIFRPLK